MTPVHVHIKNTRWVISQGINHHWLKPISARVKWLLWRVDAVLGVISCPVESGVFHNYSYISYQKMGSFAGYTAWIEEDIFSPLWNHRMCKQFLSIIIHTSSVSIIEHNLTRIKIFCKKSNLDNNDRNPFKCVWGVDYKWNCLNYDTLLVLGVHQLSHIPWLFLQL